MMSSNLETTFRDEIFALCKELQDNVEAKNICSLIHDMSVNVMNEENRIVKKSLHGDFAYVAKTSNSQFHGFLYVDENIDSLNLPMPLQVEKLSNDERILLEKGHNTLDRFINLCLEDIKKRSELIAMVINPYFRFKEVQCDCTVKPIFTDDKLSNVVSAFKRGTAYRFLVDSKFEEIFNKFNLKEFRELDWRIEKEIKECYANDDVPEDLKELSFRLAGQYISEIDTLYCYSILIYALKESLRIACQMFYEAICGNKFTVLNNDNIINIEKMSSNVVCTKYKILILENDSKSMGSGIGSILLVDCDPTNEVHLHEFGMIEAMTCKFGRTMAATTKYSLILVDDELINISNLTDNIIANVKK